jgi:hypothetical protein
MTARYDAASPYLNTPIINNEYLDTLQIRPVPAEDDDVQYVVQPQYMYRPDLLAYDLYGTTKLWWVFAQRNLDILKDPVFDMVPGLKIYLPKGNNLSQQLGV